MMRATMRVLLVAAERTSLLCALLAVGVVAFGQNAAAAAPVRFRIMGTLVSSADGSPVPHGHLTARLVGAGAQVGPNMSSPDAYDADDQGRFVINLPSAGMWNLTAWGRGFVRNGYLGHEQYSSGVVLTREHPTVDIRFVLAPEAEITGKVVDEAGEAVRGARVSLIRSRTATPDGRESMPASTAITDDRGIFEFDGLEPGAYRISVSAQPWYAAAAAQGRRTSPDDPPLDPSLDVAYQVTWFPGVSDPDAAQTLMLKGGDVREADFHLVPIPAVHLLIDPPTSADGNRNVQYFPFVQRIDSGTNLFVQPRISRNAAGQTDVGGLTPGVYQVQLNGPNGTVSRSIVHVTAGGGQTVDFDAGSNDAEVSMHIDGLPVSEANALIVNLLDPVSGRAVATSTRPGAFMRRGFRLQDSALKGSDNDGNSKEIDRTLDVPPGRYEVVILGRQDVYLGGITATGAQAAGRQVTLPAGASSLTLHVVEGRATLTGFTARDGKPSVGSLVMLVPASLGEPGALQIVRRDESNTDGSFNIADVIPGQYILIAVEDAWDINWKDKATLARYLDGGVAVNLAAKSSVAQNVTAQRP